jgi:hypothetical protein
MQIIEMPVWEGILKNSISSFAPPRASSCSLNGSLTVAGRLGSYSGGLQAAQFFLLFLPDPSNSIVSN